MNDEKRAHEASSLRVFFDEQLHHLQGLVSQLSWHMHDEQQVMDEETEIVERFVDASNAKMRAINGYADRLRGGVRALYEHVLQVAGEIPPPVDLSQDAFRADPLVNALFVYSKEINKLFDSDPEAHAYLSAHDKDTVPVVYALLTATKREKHILGIGMQGQMLIRDVPQETVNFSAHKIHMPCASKAELEAALRNYLFGRIVTLVKQELTLRMSDHVVKPSDLSYESRISSLANPEVYLNTLIEYLEVPAKLLSIDKAHFRLSKLGVKLAANDRQCANEFDIHELTWSDNSRNVVLLIAHLR